MRPIALVLALLVAAPSSAAGMSRQRGPYVHMRTRGPVAGAAGPVALMHFLQTAPVAPAINFCATAAVLGLLQGNYVCVNGDGTSTGLAITAIGSPATTSANTCAAGITCSSTVTTMTGTNAYRTAGVTAPTGDVSTLVLLNSSDVTSCRRMVSKSGVYEEYECAPTGAVNFLINGTTNAASDASSAVDTGTWGLWGTSYHPVTSGTSVMKHYQNGYLMNTVSTAVSPLTASSTVPWAFGAQMSSAGSSVTGQFIGSFAGGLMTETLLTQAQIQAFEVALGRKAADSLGNVVNYAHAQAFSCTSDSGTVSGLGRNAACFLRGGLSINSSVTASIPNAATAGASRMCQFATVDPIWGGWPISNQHVMDCGSDLVTHDLTQMWIGNDGYLYGKVFDSSGTQHTANASTAGGIAVWGGPHRLGLCYGTAGLELWEDNQQLTLTDTGNATTSISMSAPQSTCYLGSDGRNSGSSIPGAVKDVCIATDPAACLSAVPARASATNKVAAIGDSITRGQFATNSYGYPQLIEQQINALSTTRVDNWARGSATCANMVTTWRTYIKGKGYTHLFVMCGTNDAFSDISGASSWSSLQTIADEARAEGITVVLLTTPPFGNSVLWSSARETQLQALRTSILNYCTANSLNCVDANTILHDPANPTKLLPANDYGDGTHMTAAGNAALVTPLRTALGL
jgi:lysophospholipase L1-like esterase